MFINSLIIHNGAIASKNDTTSMSPYVCIFLGKYSLNEEVNGIINIITFYYYYSRLCCAVLKKCHTRHARHSSFCVLVRERCSTCDSVSQQRKAQVLFKRSRSGLENNKVAV